MILREITDIDHAATAEHEKKNTAASTPTERLKRPLDAPIMTYRAWRRPRVSALETGVSKTCRARPTMIERMIPQAMSAHGVTYTIATKLATMNVIEKMRPVVGETVPSAIGLWRMSERHPHAGAGSVRSDPAYGGHHDRPVRPKHPECRLSDRESCRQTSAFQHKHVW